MQSGAATWKGRLTISSKLNHTLPSDPATAFLGTYSKEPKTYVHTKASTQMFIAALFVLLQFGSNQNIVQ
jgi:hypothetical protein